MTQSKVIRAFYQKQPDITINLTLYSKMEETARRSFYLRNLAGQSDAEQIAEAVQIMNEVAEELHYLTGFGVDKGEVKLNGQKVDEVVYPEYGTEFYMFHDGAIFKFSPFKGYVWAKDGKFNWQLYEHLIADGWQVEIASLKAEASFRLPCVLINQQQRHLHPPENAEFFGVYPSVGRRKKRRNETLIYDQENPIFQRFVRRFYEEGHLCFGEKRTFASQDSYLQIQRCKWPKSKAKPKKGPRRSVLASRPTDDTEYVYIIRMGRTKNYKIGKSNDPQGRLASLQTASPYKLKLLHTFKADNATAAEESLHAALHDQRMEGEWFKLSDEQRKALVLVTAFQEGGFVAGKQVVAAETLLQDE